MDYFWQGKNTGEMGRCWDKFRLNGEYFMSDMGDEFIQIQVLFFEFWQIDKTYNIYIIV